jgi:para-aminobenzoate synthetase component 1
MATAIEPATLSLASPVVEELRPAPTAWDVARCLAGWPHLLFLDSARPGAPLGRYSFVMAGPFAWLTARGKQVWLDGTVQSEGDPFAVLAGLLSRYRIESLPGLPPFQGGAAGLFGYDLGRHLERLPVPRLDEFEVPELAVGLYDWVIAFDHLANRAWIVSTGLPEYDPAQRRRRARERLLAVRRVLSGPPGSPPLLSGEMVTPALQYPLPGLTPEIVSRSTWRSGCCTRRRCRRWNCTPG